MLDPDAYPIEDAALSDQRIDDAPVVIRTLFREFDAQLVFAALDKLGMDQDPATLSDEVVEATAVLARKLIVDHINAKINLMLGLPDAH